MKKLILFPLLLISINFFAQAKIDTLMPVRGFSIAAPLPNNVNEFVKFIDKELAPRSINTLILRVDYNYQYNSHPELRDSIALSSSQVKKIVTQCKKSGIKIVPQINLLGHQSWAETTLNLLRVYPEFDETPHIKMMEKHEWPNKDGLYCKSYCPLHPGVHKVVFALVDELLSVFEADDFHAGLDEVFFIGDDSCSRCAGHNKAKLFADEVLRIRNHLALSNKKLWMWGDRLLNAKTTGLGMWEASMNNTHQAIDMIPTDVFICDWHYERPDKTAVYFAMKGFKVATCPWRNPEIAKIQVDDMLSFRSGSTPEMKENFQGIILTCWSSAKAFMDRYYNDTEESTAKEMLQIFDNIEK